ncbi:MAG: metallophosphoesterase [Mycoplasma sp.]
MYKIFIISDTHGLNDELFEKIKMSEFNLSDENNFLIFSGDMVDQNIDINKTDLLLENLFNLIDKNKNIVYLTGNHERIISEKGNSKFSERLKQLPIAAITENIFTCHGWINPKWKISEHRNKKDYSLDPIISYGDIINGSPASIYIRKKLNTDFFGYTEFGQYEDLLLKKYPNYIFVFGHYFNFFWDFEKIRGIHYFQYADELKKFNNGEPSLIDAVVEEYDYSKPYINKYKNIYAIDLYTKCYSQNLPYHIKFVQFNSLNKPIPIYEDDKRYLDEIIKDNFNK